MLIDELCQCVLQVWSTRRKYHGQARLRDTPATRLVDLLGVLLDTPTSPHTYSPSHLVTMQRAKRGKAYPPTLPADQLT